MFGGEIFKCFKNEDEPFQERMKVAFAKIINLALIVFDEDYQTLSVAKIKELLKNYLFEMILEENNFGKVLQFFKHANYNILDLRDVVNAFGIHQLIKEEINNSYMQTWDLIVLKDLGITLTCSMCDKETEQVCNKCGCTLYCSKRCQKEDWKEHKVLCKEFVGET